MENVLSKAIARSMGWDGNPKHCRSCNSEAGEFRDEISKKEWKISHLCQKCQDAVFVPDDEEEGEYEMGPPEKNRLTIGDWTYDVFICEDGSLGITVYPEGETVTDETQCHDIFVDVTDFTVKSF